MQTMGSRFMACLPVILESEGGFVDAVNQGPGRALRTLQEAVGAVPDGVYGPATQAALAASLPAQTVERIADLREAQYRALPTFGRFGKGWLARLARTKALALEA